MKKTMLILSLLTVVIIGSAGVLHAEANTPTTSDTPITTQDIEQLDAQDIHLEKPDSAAIITSDTAIQNASDTFPGWAHDAKEINAEYQLITNHSFRGFSQEALDHNPHLKQLGYMDKLPVYIVTFKGMSYYAHVPAKSNGVVPVHHEYNVIVDATSGEPLMGFSYR